MYYDDEDKAAAQLNSRALIWSTTLDGRRPINNQARRGRNTIFVSRSTAASTLCDVQMHAADPTGLVATDKGDHSKKKKTYTLLNDTEEEKLGCISSHDDTQRNENHSSIPHQNTTKDQKHTTVFPLLIPFHSQSSRCCFPITQMQKKREKRHQPGTKRKAENGRLKCTIAVNEVPLSSDHRLTRFFHPLFFFTSRTWRHDQDHPVSDEDPFEMLSSGADRALFPAKRRSAHPPQFQLTLVLATQKDQTRNHSASN